MRTGGCLCGTLRYETSAAPLFVVHCYCENCRRESGSDHLTHMAVPSEEVNITGAYQAFDMAHPNGTIRRLFCGACGTTILGRPASMPGYSNIRMGTLDEVGDLKPQAAVFCARVRGWTVIDPDVQRFDELPPR